ncbi:hypothetical protein G6514_006116 [Epicoccum nigrum]|nr:hypothetical protein G6514_006116 [Epicoccum nigrum]
MRSDFEIILSDRDREALAKDGFEVDAELSDGGNDDDGNDLPKDAATDAQSHRQRPLRKKQLSELLRLAAIDNFQGEEAKVIIVSMLPATGFHVTNAVPSFFTVAISVLAFVAKTVQLDTVSNVA